jgi:LDH2 family malate/lactate/ureidoglycolate dehydrogenase
MSKSQLQYHPGEAIAFAESCFIKLGLSAEDAARAATLMVQADQYGYGTHGLFRLRQYVDRLKGGGINPTPNITLKSSMPAVAVVNGDNGMGHLAMDTAADTAVEIASRQGIGWVGVNNSNHAGPAAIYVQRIVDQGMIGLYGAVGSANHVPPFGGTELLLGTNPMAIAVPTRDGAPFILDMATTVAAMGKIKTLAQQGKPMPEGWMIGKDGAPLTDPTKRDDGFLLPIGGPKGYGLALAIGLLAGTLNGAALGNDVVDFTKNKTDRTNTGQFIAALNIAAFGDLNEFFDMSATVFEDLRNSPPLPGHDPVRIPGENRTAVFDQRGVDGIPYNSNLIAVLNTIAKELGVSEPKAMNS